ncbi:MAG: DarT ssDNA thymidine ADP-ribosyltransferase family protein [Glaciihabitans sp.]
MRPRQAASATATATRAPARRTPTRAAGAPPEDVGSQRIYHLTHVKNLADILSAGRLLADGNSEWDARPTVDISSADNRAARRNALLAAGGSSSVANYVPFALTPKSSIWEGVLGGEADDRLASSVLDIAPADFVMLVTTVKAVFEATDARDGSNAVAVAVTDGDAANPLTRFGSTRDAAERQIRKLRADQLSEVILDAELLVADEFPVERVTLIGVANDRARDVVKSILQDFSFRPKVAVYPPWFRPAEDPAI